MLARILLGALILTVGLAATGAALYLRNAAPEAPQISAAEAENPTKPYVVKLHAQWCPVCMLTKDEWAEIVVAYAGRVNLVVFDSTNDSTAARSRAEAERLGLDRVLDDYHGATGLVVVIDPRTRQVAAELAGNLAFDDYRAAIDAALGTR